MNQFFSFQRFNQLAAKHWSDHKKRYTISGLALLGLLTIAFVFAMLVEDGHPISKDAQLFIFVVGALLSGSFYASQYFRDLGSRPKGINFLLVPASGFEKLLCALLFTVVLFPIVYLAAYHLVDYFMVAISNRLADPAYHEKATMIRVFGIFRMKINPDTFVNLLTIFFPLQSAFLLGSVFFSKYSFPKTVISGFLVFFTGFCLMYFFYEYLLPNGYYPEGFFSSYHILSGDNKHYVIQIPRWVGVAIWYLFMYASAPFLWLVTYYRLKEKQV